MRLFMANIEYLRTVKPCQIKSAIKYVCTKRKFQMSFINYNHLVLKMHVFCKYFITKSQWSKYFEFFNIKLLLTHFHRNLEIIPGAISKIVRTFDLTIYGIIFE